MTEVAVLRLVLSLLFIIALIFSGAWVIRRGGWLRGTAAQPIKLLGTQSLGSRSYVALVQVENTRLALGVTTQQISLLHAWIDSAQNLDAHDEHRTVVSGNFSDALTRAVRKQG